MPPLAYKLSCLPTEYAVWSDTTLPASTPSVTNATSWHTTSPVAHPPHLNVPCALEPTSPPPTSTTAALAAANEFTHSSNVSTVPTPCDTRPPSLPSQKIFANDHNNNVVPPRLVTGSNPSLSTTNSHYLCQLPSGRFEVLSTNRPTDNKSHIPDQQRLAQEKYAMLALKAPTPPASFHLLTWTTSFLCFSFYISSCSFFGQESSCTYLSSPLIVFVTSIEERATRWVRSTLRRCSYLVRFFLQFAQSARAL